VIEKNILCREKGDPFSPTFEDADTIRGTSYIAPVKRENEKDHLL